MFDYLVSLGVFVGLYALMALGLNVVWGIAGMINLGLVGFYAIGAYGSALLAVKVGVPIPVAILAGVLASATAGAAVAVITARLRGDYLAIVTLGLAEVLRLVASNEIWLTGGTDGISAIPGPFRADLSPRGFNLLCLVLVWAAVTIVWAVLSRIVSAPFGRVLRALREDEMVAAVAGKPVLSFKVRAFALSSAALGLAGALYAHYNGYVAPDAFQSLVTLYVFLALTAGGSGRMAGAVLGALIVVALTEGTRFLSGWLPGLHPAQVAAVRSGVIGLALILLLHLRPQGVLPERTRRLLPDHMRTG
jgi:branched-chain amino acid transport system permease protein